MLGRPELTSSSALNRSRANLVMWWFNSTETMYTYYEALRYNMLSGDEFSKCFPTSVSVQSAGLVKNKFSFKKNILSMAMFYTHTQRERERERERYTHRQILI